MVYCWKNKVVLITGAATGIGAATVRQIINEKIKHVAVLDVNDSAGIELERELNSNYGTVIVKFYTCDVTNEELLLSVFEDVKNSQGYIDVVINNAGIMNDTPNLFKKEIEVNVIALVTATLKAMELMRKDKGGHGGTVINISSTAGLLQLPMMPIYFATKSAVLQFSNCLGLDEYYTKTGVRVLALCFGKTDTPLISMTNLGGFDPEFDKNIAQIADSHPIQTAESAAQGVVEAFKQGESGSTWLINNNKPAEDITANIRKAYNTMSLGVFD